MARAVARVVADVAERRGERRRRERERCEERELAPQQRHLVGVDEALDARRPELVADLLGAGQVDAEERRAAAGSVRRPGALRLDADRAGHDVRVARAQERPRGRCRSAAGSRSPSPTRSGGAQLERGLELRRLRVNPEHVDLAIEQRVRPVPRPRSRRARRSRPRAGRRSPRASRAAAAGRRRRPAGRAPPPIRPPIPPAPRTACRSCGMRASLAGPGRRPRGRRPHSPTGGPARATPQDARSPHRCGLR